MWRGWARSCLGGDDSDQRVQFVIAGEQGAPLRWVRLHLARMREEGELELPFEPRAVSAETPMYARRSTSCSRAD